MNKLAARLALLVVVAATPSLVLAGEAPKDGKSGKDKPGKEQKDPPKKETPAPKGGW